MRDRVEIQPVQSLRASIRPPGSKSITNRALICAALANGRSVLRGVLDSDDTRVMINALTRLDIRVEFDATSAIAVVTGCGGKLPGTTQLTESAATHRPSSVTELFVGNSGTTIRFLVAMLAACHGRFRLDGIERMRQRPIADLLEALRSLGADIQSEASNGCPPVVMQATGLHGGTVSIRGDISSQFLSGLLMAVPYASASVDINVVGQLVSQPYVHMTTGVMKSFGVTVDCWQLDRIHVPAPMCYQACEYSVEPDASAASYFWGAAAVTGGTVTVEGLAREALQGDVGFCECLERMGCQVRYENDRIVVTGRPLRGIEVNMNAISDTVQTLAAVALFADGPTTISGVGHIRHKETDRIGDLAREIRKLGAQVDEFSDGLRITPAKLKGAAIETYNDHRMAMSLSLVGLRIPHVVILDPGCTAKTYPNFFLDLEKVCRGN